MIFFCNALLPNDRMHAIPADISKTIKPIPVIDKGIEVDVSPMGTIVSTDSKFVFRVLSFLKIFLIYGFAFEVFTHFYNVVDMVIKTIYIILFFSSLCFKSMFYSSGELGYILSHF